MNDASEPRRRATGFTAATASNPRRPDPDSAAEGGRSPFAVHRLVQCAALAPLAPQLLPPHPIRRRL